MFLYFYDTLIQAAAGVQHAGEPAVGHPLRNEGKKYFQPVPTQQGPFKRSQGFICLNLNKNTKQHFEYIYYSKYNLLNPIIGDDVWTQIKHELYRN